MLVCVRDQVEVSKHRHFEAAGTWQGQARPGKKSAGRDHKLWQGGTTACVV